MKVYIVRHWRNGAVCEVFSSPEKAQAYVNESSMKKWVTEHEVL